VAITTHVCPGGVDLPKVTIVVSTYNRPHLLRWTIESILQQSYQDWLLLIVGDDCSAETAEMIADFKDDRIFFVNLEERCGEQSGPNTAGMYAAFTDYVAFANHDDIWLPDHLEKAITVLEAGGTDFYCSSAAITTFEPETPGRPGGYCVVSASPKHRKIEQAFYNSAVFFEPVSCWVIRRSLFRKVGAWRPASRLYRTPLEDWILRAWRADVSCHFSDDVTVIYCNGEKSKEKRSAQVGSMYDMDAAESEFWMALLKENGLEMVRARLLAEAADPPWQTTLFAPPMSGNPHQWVFDALVTPDTARVFKETGWDGYTKASKIAERKPGRRLEAILNRRTGEKLPQTTKDWRQAAFFVAAQLAENRRWQGLKA